MIHRLGFIALGFVLAAAAGCSSGSSAKTPMSMEGVAELPDAKSKQVATYRCSIDLNTGRSEVNPGNRAGKAEETAWKNLSAKLKQGSFSYEVLIEKADKNAKGSNDWALVTVLETEADSGRLIRKFPVYEFWGTYDKSTPRAIMLKDGHLQFFVQFWTAD